VYFSWLVRVCVGLIMLAAFIYICSPGFLASYLSARFGRFFQVSVHARGLCKFYANAGGKKMTITAPTTLTIVQDKHQANPFLSIKIISRNVKNKQLTILSQFKLALTAINKLFAL
jgi:hypothetical protein